MPTVRVAVQEAIEVFQDAQLASPDNDARWLMAYALAHPGDSGWPLAPVGLGEVFLAGGDEAPSVFAEWVQRRSRREPLQHIVASAPFFGYDFFSDARGFIPRPETELLTDWALQRCVDMLRENQLRQPGVLRIVDLCSGPGTIALALAAQLSEYLEQGAVRDYSHTPAEVEITAVELDEQAIGLGEENLGYFQREGLLSDRVRIQLVQGDVRELGVLDCLGLHGTADVVVANPPYVPAAAQTDIETSADPAIAVFSGEDGLELMPFVARALRYAAAPGAPVAIEHDDVTGPQTQEILASHGGLEIEQHQDFSGRPRFVTGRFN